MSDSEGMRGFLQRMMDAADERGWDVLEATLRSPGHVTVLSRNHPYTTVTVESELGLDNAAVLASLPTLSKKAAR